MIVPMVVVAGGELVVRKLYGASFVQRTTQYALITIHGQVTALSGKYGNLLWRTEYVGQTMAPLVGLYDAWLR
jgi:hypothetical protein